jgi:hypothetical protein
VKDEKIIARIPRNANDELVIRTFNYWNINVVDMRWYNNGNPTRKGLRVNFDEAKTLIKAIIKSIGDENGNNKFNEEED